jgi:uncharacterized protein YdeI (YjbR/CyaY-like superfamily)
MPKSNQALRKPTFFKTQADWRKWLEQHHDKETELLVGFYKKESGKPSITWPESVDEALCFGWIDGIRKRVDDVSYTIRFTPRKTSSIWSAVNIKHVERLTAAGQMRPAGQKAFEARKENRSGIYAYEQRPQTFEGDFEKKFKANKKAWAYWESQPPYYRRTATWWVISAKKEETKRARLETLINDSAAGRPIAQLTRTPKK